MTAPSIDWLLEDAIEIHPNIWRAESPLPATASWPVPDCGDRESHADVRGPRLVIYEPDRPEPRAMCLYPSEMGWINMIAADLPIPPTSELPDEADQAIVAGMLLLSCPWNPSSPTWEAAGIDALPASHLLLAIEDYDPVSMTREIGDVLLAISRGESNDAPATPLDLGLTEYMISEGASDPGLLGRVRDDQIFRLFRTMDRLGQDVPIEDLLEIVELSSPDELFMARKRGEDRRRSEGLE